MKKVIAAFCIGSALVMPAVAEAQESVTAELFYSEADLNSTEGAKETYESLVSQARLACKVKSLGYIKVDEVCVADIVGQAVEGINAPILTAVYEGDELPLVLAAR